MTTETVTLDDAWEDAEAALPNGWRVVAIYAAVLEAPKEEPERWQAWAGMTANPGPGDPFVVWAEAPTPATALLALADKLRSRP